MIKGFVNSYSTAEAQFEFSIKRPSPQFQGAFDGLLISPFELRGGIAQPTKQLLPDGSDQNSFSPILQEQSDK
jgi:hypothetical protein